MPIAFDKSQIVSSTEIVRSFARYIERELGVHDIFIFKRNMPEAVLVAYDRYEQLMKQLEELKELLEHVAIYEMIEQRKDSPEKEISIEKLQKKYGL